MLCGDKQYTFMFSELEFKTGIATFDFQPFKQGNITLCAK